MMKMTCPFCKAPLTMPDEYEGTDVDCPACKKTFAAVPDDGTATDLVSKQVKIPKSVMNGKWEPMPATKGSQKHFPDDSCTNGDSAWAIVPWFIGGGVLCAVAVGVGIGANMPVLIILSYVIASILVLIWALWMLVCLRTIAINSSSTLRQTNNTRLHL